MEPAPSFSISSSTSSSLSFLPPPSYPPTADAVSQTEPSPPPVFPKRPVMYNTACQVGLHSCDFICASFTVIQASTSGVAVASQTPPPPTLVVAQKLECQSQTDDIGIGSCSVGVQAASWDIEGCCVDAAVMAVADSRCYCTAYVFICSVRVLCHSCLLSGRPMHTHTHTRVFLPPRTAHCQTSTSEGSASVACGCDVALACTGVQTEEEWTDAAAAAAAAAETIEGLQQELVGSLRVLEMLSTPKTSFASRMLPFQVHWVRLNDEYSQLLNVRLS